jgi:signal transduction histidine kinase
MKFSVRSRLTLGVAVLAGAVALAAALVAPRLIEDALVDDSLAAEAASSRTVLDSGLFSGFPAGEIGTLGLPDNDLRLLVPDLSSTDALAEMQARSPQGEVVVVVDSSLAVRIGTEGKTTIEPIDATTFEHPVVALEEYNKIAVEMNVGPALLGGPLLDVLDQAPPTQPAADLTYGVVTLDGKEWIVAAPLDNVRRSVDRVRAVLWWGLPIATLLAGAITWLLASRALRPVRLITDRTSQITAGTLHQRVPVPATNDEIATLADTMNSMLDRLQRHDEQRRRFVSDASHELRSPVAAMRTEAEVALRSTTPVDGHTLAAGMLAESTRLGTIVDDLLSLARRDEGLPPPGAPIDLDDIVFETARRPRRVPIDVRAVSAGRVRARPDEMSRVVGHLLDNAARHARTQVAVGLDTNADWVTLTVDDDGPGVPEPQRSGIFERFVRLDDARARDHGGAGLGLAVVAAVARSLGGTVDVSDSPQGGARFAVRLPSAG